MARDWNIAVLLIEHDGPLVRRVADRVIALNLGQPIASGAPEEVLSHPAVVEAYLGESEAAEDGAEAWQPAGLPPADTAGLLPSYPTNEERSD